MPRTARNDSVSKFQHIVVQGDEKKFIFKKDVSKLRYLRLLMRNATLNNVHILAYCIMDNHVHILVYLPPNSNISKMMLQTGTSFGIYYSRIRHNVGHVFRDRYKNEPILSISHLINCIKYIHENPVKAALVTSPSQYVYSSFNEYRKKIGCYNQLFSLNILSSKDLLSVIIPSSNELVYLEEKQNFELTEKVFREIINLYNIRDLNKKQIHEIYTTLRTRCNTPKRQIAKMLNISYYKLMNIIQSSNQYINE